ncbi:MAG: MBL fold metallo-hydrolase [Planctomycetes bacterium]|nr:MBL fold metallo-hydrolase [Planctomycetota bacterium]
MKHHALAVIAAAFVGLPSFGQDAERAAHVDSAAVPQLSYEVRDGDFVLRQYQLGCLSQLTYLVGSAGRAAVIDPQRDVEHYLVDARALGLTIEKVVLTHTNADFVAGHTELARRVGAEILISERSGSSFPHHGLVDGERVSLGNADLEFWATPGHTLDSMSVLIRPRADGPTRFVATGDTLFVGGIGRPDLVGGETTPVVLAGLAYDSIARLKTLADDVVVLPAHGAGSLCGAHLSPETTSTIGRERTENPYLAELSRSRFVARVVTGLPLAPRYFAHNVAINRRGPPVVDWSAELPAPLAPDAVERELANGGWLVDVREAPAYMAEHVRGAVNVSVRGRLDTWTGSIVPFDAPIVLCGTDDEVREATFRFRRIGLDVVKGYLAGGIEAWRTGGRPTAHAKRTSPRELAKAIELGREPMIVDVRTPAEYGELRVGDFANVPLHEYEHFATLLDRHAPVVFVCNSAYRSSMAIGLAERLGFEDVASLDGGLDAWLAEGLATVGDAPVCAKPAATGTGDRVLLPEPLEPKALAALLADQPQSYAVLDVRPRAAFDEYHVPGALHTPIDELDVRIAELERGDARRIVLVDRDGTLAWALAGRLLAADGTRDLRVLTGGTARFWLEVEAKGGAPQLADRAPTLHAPRADEAPAAEASAPKPRDAQKPKSKPRPAGC